MKFYDMKEDQQKRLMARVRKAGAFDTWYDAMFDAEGSIKDMVCNAMAAAVADALTRVEVWAYEDGQISVDVADYEFTTEHFDVPMAESDDHWGSASDLEWNFANDD